jgi:hypothetical protein
MTPGHCNVEHGGGSFLRGVRAQPRYNGGIDDQGTHALNSTSHYRTTSFFESQGLEAENGYWQISVVNICHKPLRNLCWF